MARATRQEIVQALAGEPDRPRARCALGNRCDRDRIHVPLREFRTRGAAASVVLCAEHQAELDAA